MPRLGNALARAGFAALLYWSPATGAIPVTGQIWVDYEGMGESGAIGLPLSAAVAIPGGVRQIFQLAQMFSKTTASKAFEVHGAILAKYLATGGPARYEGKDMKAVHSGMHISNPEFDAVIGDLKVSLDRFQIPNKEQKELLAIVESTRPQIVEER